jgi:hypothetical protein
MISTLNNFHFIPCPLAMANPETRINVTNQSMAMRFSYTTNMTQEARILQRSNIGERVSSGLTLRLQLNWSRGWPKNFANGNSDMKDTAAIQ